jgi:hypothetical protein
MRLADDMLAARGTLNDIGGFAAHMAPWIETAERFEVADEVARAAGDLIDSRPSSLVAALPLCRLPYETMWVEYRGGLGKDGGVGRRKFDDAPTPSKQGVLIESMPGGQTGFMTVAWVHTCDAIEHAVNISPISIYFDWRENGNVRNIIHRAHNLIISSIPDPIMRDLVGLYRQKLESKWMTADMAAIRATFTGRDRWEDFRDAREIEAMKTLDRHMMPGISPHGTGIIGFVLARGNAKEIQQFMLKWEADVQGEGGWVQCFLAMLNTKNPCVEHEAVDLTRLNKARRKNGRSQFLPYRRTRLALSRSQARIAAARGIDRESARQHLVRGHFKIRKTKTGTGVFWWSSFLRGDASKGAIKREEYEIHGG